MNSRLLLISLALALSVAVGAAAQNSLNLRKTTTRPRVDGIVTEKEYTLTADAPDMQIGLSWTTDVLYVGVSGQTSGWVAVGIGSGVMDGAMIYMGYVSGGKTHYKVQKGAGHSHGDTRMDAPVNYAMSKTGGKTTLEVALKASEFISPGQTQLDLILAMGTSGSFSEYHKSRYGTSVTLSP